MRFHLVLLLVLVACNRPTGSSTTSASSTSTFAPAITASATPTKQEPPSIDAVLAAFKAAKIPMTALKKYDETSDPNKLLGRPHQYTAKAVWTDSRSGETGEPGTDTGGTVEIFATPEDCDKRAKYVDSVTSAVSALSEYDYKKPFVLVRLTHKLAPSQAKEYEAALNALP